MGTLRAVREEREEWKGLLDRAEKLLKVKPKSVPPNEVFLLSSFFIYFLCSFL